MPYDTTSCAEQPWLNWIDRHRRWVGLAIVCLTLAGFNGQYRIGPDSAMYICTGRAMSRGLGYTYNGQTNTVAYPGLPLLVRACYTLSPSQGLLLTLVLMLGFGLAYPVFTYFFFLQHAGRAVAVSMTGLVAVSYNFYRQSFEILTDLPFALGVMIVLLAYEQIIKKHPCIEASCIGPTTHHQQHSLRGTQLHHHPTRKINTAYWMPWLMMVMGLILATLMRPTVITLILAIFLAALWSLVRKQSRGTHLWLAGIAIIVLTFFYLFDPRSHIGAYLENRTYEAGLVSLCTTSTLTRSLTQFVPMFLESIAAETMIGIELGPGINTLFAIFLLMTGFFLFTIRPFWGGLIACTVVMMLIFSPHPRYFLPIQPLLLYGLWLGTTHLAARFSPSFGGWVIGLTLALLIGPNAAKVGKFIARQHMSPFYAHYKNGRYASLPRLGETLNQLVPQDAMILAKFGSELSFVSDRRVYTASELAKHKTDSQVYQLLIGEKSIFVVQPPDLLLKHWMASIPLPLGPSLATVEDSPTTTWTVHPVKTPTLNLTDGSNTRTVKKSRSTLP